MGKNEIRGKTMELTRKQFSVLKQMILDGSLSQRQISEKTDLSLGTVNRTIKELSDVGYVSNGRITESGLNAMEPHKAK